MALKIGLVGKPNVGKSTFFAAATLVEAEIGDYPFTTIDANRGMGAIRTPDPGPDLDVISTPRTGFVQDTTRFVPVELVDVAGLVPGAHEGRGLGNKFLTDLSQADALIHIVDATGTTDAEGNPGVKGHDPMDDVRFLEAEIDAWIEAMIRDGWDRLARRCQQEHLKPETAIHDRLSGIGVSEAMAMAAMRDSGVAGRPPTDWESDELHELAVAIRKRSKPMLVAFNKADMVDVATLNALLTQVDGSFAVCAQAELALAKARQANAIEHLPGSGAITPDESLTDAQKKGLDYIQQKVLDRFDGTGLHKALEHAVLQLLGRIPVFPVENDHAMTDKEGRVLPDCHLVKQGTTAKDLAYLVHTDLGDKFVRGIDCRSKRTIGADHELNAGDVIRIAANA
jgi:ribosome-binding ATPase YchF (GTP1/OBG family)